MIFENVDALESILRIDDADDYPHIDAVLKPAAERAVIDAVGEAWITQNAADPTVIQAACALLAAWFEKPEMYGELTPGANFMLTQLQARALAQEQGE